MITQAQAVIIGGGVGGASIAYHLTLLGMKDVVVLDRGALTSGSTFHSAGLVGQLRSSVTLTKMMMYGVELYGKLAKETGEDTGWRQVGSLRLASTKERMEELRRQAGWAKTFGLPMELITAKEAQKLFPLMVTDGVEGAVWLPTDGYLDPSLLTTALAAGAKKRGAKVFENTRVLEIKTLNGRVTEVVTDKGSIKTQFVVNAGGQWAPEIARMVGVTVPIIPFAHEYLITKPMEGIPKDLPQMRDPDNLVYFREEVGGLIMGGYERHPAPWGLDGIPKDFNYKLLDPDWDRFQELMEGAIRRVPSIENAEIVKLINGPEAFTPDGEFIMGESPEVRGFFTAAGFCAHGIAGAGGIGKMMAEWIVEGEPSLDLWKMDIRRFGRHYSSQKYTLERTLEVYESYYDIHYPFEEKKSARKLRLSPVYSRLEELKASFGEKSGWERPNWFDSNASAEFENTKPRGWAGRYWSAAIGAEHKAAREAAGLFDETSFSKIEIFGQGALKFLQSLTDNNVDKPVGSIIYTQLLNKRGGIECDLTVTRLAHDRFRLVTGTAFGAHDYGWIRRHMPEDGSVYVLDVTDQYCCIGLWGPKAREILTKVCRDDVSNAGFPYMTAKNITVGKVPALAARVTYVGELGWEFYAPMDYGRELWDCLMEAGRPLGLKPAGYRAIDSLRLEKGYRYWSADITPERNPIEAGMGFCVKFDKGDFIGRDVLVKVKEKGPAQKLCCLTLEDPNSVCLGGEPVKIEGKIAGRVTSGGYGYTVGKSIAYAYLDSATAKPGVKVSVEIFGDWISGEIAKEPLYDPEMKKIKA